MHLMNHYPSKALNNLLILSSPSWIRGGWGASMQQCPYSPLSASNNLFYLYY